MMEHLHGKSKSLDAQIAANATAAIKELWEMTANWKKNTSHPIELTEVSDMADLLMQFGDLAKYPYNTMYVKKIGDS